MRLFIVRHGQTAWNLDGRAQGHTDVPLDDVGLSQAEALAADFDPDCRIDTVFTSDLLRASQTAEPLAKKLRATLVLRQDLRERCFGDCEGLVFSDLHARVAKLAQESGVRPSEVTPPGGETIPEVWDRLTPFVEELDARQGSAIVVTHGGSGSLLMAKLVRGTIESARSFSFGNTGFCELERRDDGYFKILRYNDTSHLSRSTEQSGIEGTVH